MAKTLNCNVLVEGTHNLSLDEWRSKRKVGLGGSDAGSVAGVSKYSSPLKVYIDKLGLKEDQQEENEFMYWGNKLEDLVAEEFKTRAAKDAKIPGREGEGIEFKVQRRNAILQHSNPLLYFMLANVDRLLYDKELGWGVLECKTTSEYGKFDWIEGEIPDYYYLQVQHYLAVTDLNYAYIAVLIGGNKYEYRYIERDQEIIDYLVQLETKFWLNNIEARVPPAPIGKDSDDEAMKVLFSDTHNTSATLSPDLEFILNDLDQVKAEEKELKDRRKQLEQTIQNEMKENEVAYVGERKVSWKYVTSNRFDSKTFKKDHKDLYEKYTKESTSRRFSI